MQRHLQIVKDLPIACLWDFRLSSRFVLTAGSLCFWAVLGRRPRKRHPQDRHKGVEGTEMESDWRCVCRKLYKFLICSKNNPIKCRPDIPGRHNLLNNIMKD